MTGTLSSPIFPLCKIYFFFLTIIVFLYLNSFSYEYLIKVSLYFNINLQVNISSALLGNSHPNHSLRQMRPSSGSWGRFTGWAAKNRSERVLVVARKSERKISAVTLSGLGQNVLSELRKSGRARDGHDGHLRRFVLVLLQIPGLEVMT
jgi:hypothetical protein